MLEFGGGGGILVASHIVGDQMREMWDAAQAGDLERAREIDAELTPVYEAIAVTTNPIPLKAALEMLGLCRRTHAAAAGAGGRRAARRRHEPRSRASASRPPAEPRVRDDQLQREERTTSAK